MVPRRKADLFFAGRLKAGRYCKLCAHEPFNRRPRMGNMRAKFDFFTIVLYAMNLPNCKPERSLMALRCVPIIILLGCLTLTSCGYTKYLKGGIHREIDENLTIVSLMENPNNYLNKEVVFSVRYYKKGDIPCPLGDDYVNILIADRVSYITLNKVWIKKENAAILEKLKEMDTIVLKARVFKIDKEKDPNLEALSITPE